MSRRASLLLTGIFALSAAACGGGDAQKFRDPADPAPAGTGGRNGAATGSDGTSQTNQKGGDATSTSTATGAGQQDAGASQSSSSSSSGSNTPAAGTGGSAGAPGGSSGGSTGGFTGGVTNTTTGGGTSVSTGGSTGVSTGNSSSSSNSNSSSSSSNNSNSSSSGSSMGGASGGASGGSSGAGTGGTGAPGAIVTQHVPLGAAEMKAVVINDPQALAQAGFSLARTLDAIIASKAGASSAAAREALLQTMIGGFSATSAVNEGVRMPLTPRPGEAALRVKELLDPASANGMQPVALFNRFDLAPADGAYCGEYRIIYAMGDGQQNGAGRFFLIFEGALDNPGSGLEGCRPAAAFWSALPETADAAGALAAFYYDGIPGMNPVVTADHYGNPFGQVRGNFLVDAPGASGPWQLREWHVAQTAGGLAFVPQPAADNPLPALYRESEKNEDPALAPLRAEFLDAFAGPLLDRLLAPETAAMAAGAPVRDTDLFAGISFPVPGKFNTFESNSDGSESMGMGASGALVTRLRDALAQRQLPYPLSPFDILNRAESQTCRGCHQTAAGQTLAPSATAGIFAVTFPQPNQAFVHVDERGSLSPALREVFLPARRANLQAFLEAKPAAAALMLQPEQPASARELDRLKPGFSGLPRPVH